MKLAASQHTHMSCEQNVVNTPEATKRLQRDGEATGLRKRQLRMLECRCKRADKKQLDWQLANGRPTEAWRICGKHGCIDKSCLYKDLPFTLTEHERADNDMSLSEAYDEYLSRVAFKIAESRQLSKVHVTIYQAMKSFLQSPPVQCAYCLFKISCAQLGISLEYVHAATLKGIIQSATKRLARTLRPETSPDDYFVVHRYHTMIDLGCKLRDWSLEDLAVRYLISIELWRRAEAGQQRGWTFGDAERSYDVLGSTLLQFWHMDMLGFFSLDGELTAKRWTTIWDTWITQFPARRDDGLGSIVSEELQFGSDDRFEPVKDRSAVMELLGYLAGHGRRALGTLSSLI